MQRGKINNAINQDVKHGYLSIVAATTIDYSLSIIGLNMASLIRLTAQNLVKSRNVVAPVIARSFAFRKLEIDPVGMF